jgi:urease accessory protein
VTFANILPSELPVSAALARSVGRVEVSFEHERGDSCLKHLFQSGCGRVRFPSVDSHYAPEAVLINTAGGLTGGDQMSYDLVVGDGANLTVTGQAAEKIYKSIGPNVVIDACLNVGRDAYLEWLPQETILFDQARLKRINKIELTDTSKLLAVEAMVFGRQAHGETVHQAALTDGWEIRRNGKLIWYDRFKFDGEMSQILSRPALLNGARAMATLIVMGPSQNEILRAVREVDAEEEARIGATDLDGGPVIVRVLDLKPQRMRKTLVKLIQIVREKLTGEIVPMPAVWEV